MPGLPVLCEHCQHTFASRLVNVQGTVTNLTIHNCSEQCPNCGSQTRLLDGSFNYKNGVLTLVHGPQITIDALRKINDILNSAEPSASEEELDAEIQKYTGHRRFIAQITEWAERAGYAIDFAKDWKTRIVFSAWIIKEILEAINQ